MTPRLLSTLAALTALLPAAPAGADHDYPVSPHGCGYAVGFPVSLGLVEPRDLRTVFGAGVYVAPDPTATSTTYECWLGRPGSPDVRFASVTMTAEGPVLPLVGADANPSFVDSFEPAEFCERATWTSPTASGEWMLDADPATPGAQCVQLD